MSDSYSSAGRVKEGLREIANALTVHAQATGKASVTLADSIEKLASVIAPAALTYHENHQPILVEAKDPDPEPEPVFDPERAGRVFTLAPGERRFTVVKLVADTMQDAARARSRDGMTGISDDRAQALAWAVVDALDENGLLVWR